MSDLWPEKKVKRVLLTGAGGSIGVHILDHLMLNSIYANHSHNITAGEKGCIFMVWCDEKYDEKDNDTYPEEV